MSQVAQGSAATSSSSAGPSFASLLAPSDDSWRDVQAADMCWKQLVKLNVGPLSRLTVNAAAPVQHLQCMERFVTIVTKPLDATWQQLRPLDTSPDRWLLQAHLYMISITVADPEAVGAPELGHYLANSPVPWIRALIPLWIHQHAHARLGSLEESPPADALAGFVIADQQEWQNKIAQIGEQCGYSRCAMWSEVRDLIAAPSPADLTADRRRTLITPSPVHWLRMHVDGRIQPLDTRRCELSQRLDPMVRDELLAQTHIAAGDAHSQQALEQQTKLLGHQTATLQTMHTDMRQFWADQQKAKETFLRTFEAEKKALLAEEDKCTYCCGTKSGWSAFLAIVGTATGVVALVITGISA